MKFIPITTVPDKIILIHNGAFGDFLLAWPSMRALARAFPEAELRWAGSAERLRWLEPLGFMPSPSPVRKALDALYAKPSWPEALNGWAAFWFVIDKAPGIPSTGSCRFLRAIPGAHAPGHVRENYLADLAGHGIIAQFGWLEEFRALFACRKALGDTVLLFPGAGHPLKQWPLVQFFQLEQRLRTAGLTPLYVLGPAELERGLAPESAAHVSPGSLGELETLILSAQAVVGGDTGPMHLAGMLGVPGVSLFGPTSFGQWGPIGMRRAGLDLPCSPCTRTCADLACSDPRCMSLLSVDVVFKELMIAVEQCKTGFQGPGFLESRF